MLRINIVSSNIYISKVAILGSGVMGAQIAAHFANARIPVVLFDLKSKDKDPCQIVNNSIAKLPKMNPKPLASVNFLSYITPANYDDNLELLKDCDLIIEAIAERLDWKEQLYNKIKSHISKNVIFASNTSGLSINTLAKTMPDYLRSRFCGIHFFNPPRYMSLVELIPAKETNSDILDQLEEFLVTYLGKNVIRAYDTPNFIANRLGVFSMLVTCIHAKNYDIPLEVVDKITGKELGRAKSATFRTADVVGLDTFLHVLDTMINGCHDGFECYYVKPDWINALVEKGALGSKTKAGIYIKDKDGTKVFDLKTNNYRLADKEPSTEIKEILANRSWSKRFELIKNSNAPEAKFLWACFRDTFAYAGVLLGEIADSPRAMDQALRFGFGWKEGLFEIWQQAGFSKILKWIDEDIKSSKCDYNIQLPQYLFNNPDGLYKDNQYYDIKTDKFVTRHQLPVYKRQLYPELVLNEKPDIVQNIVYENDGVKLWHSGDDIGIITFKSKMCSIGMDVLNGLDNAISIAEDKFKAMVIWQEQDIFSVGANLEEFGSSIMTNGKKAVDNIITKGHNIISKKLRYSKIPVVAAVKGYAFGGGCEIMLHCDAVVASLESYIGLVEAGVGLLPGWGGSTEMAYRASLAIDSWRDFEMRYKNLALAKVATSAYEALEMGFLRQTDTIIMNSRELLYVAKNKARFIAESGYRPPVMPKFKVFGEQGIATINGLLVNMIAGKQISEHDYHIAKNIAYVMCGGDVEKNSIVSQDWVLNIEKNKFAELALSQKTADRIKYMLENGKPLRN